MALIRPLQPTFASGEISPPVYARVDIERYRSSLRTCRNFIIQPHGGASNRPGTRFVATTKYSSSSTQSAVLQEFIYNESQAYMLEWGEHYVRFYTNGARVSVTSSSISEWDVGTTYSAGDYATLPGGTVYYLEFGTSLAESPDVSSPTWTATSVYQEYTPYTNDDIDELKFESSADVMYVFHPDYQTRTLTRYGATDFRLATYSPQDGPFAADNDVHGAGVQSDTTITASATTGSVSLTASSSIFTSTDVGSLFKVTHFVDGQKVSESLTSATSTSSIEAFTTWRIITHGTWTAKFDIEKSSDGGTTWTVIRSFSSNDDFNVDTSGTEDVEIHTEPFKVRVTVTSYTSGTLSIDLTSDAYYQDGIGTITTYNASTSVYMTTVNDLGSTASTDTWAHGAWSDTRGWPSVGRFYQDRLCLAANDSGLGQQTIWMSRTGYYDSFLRHVVLLDTDGITVSLPSRQINKINGLIGLTRLVVLTNSSVWSVGSSSTGVITPTTVDTRIENYRGSAGVRPVIVGNEIMYMQSNGKTVRNLGYEFASDSFTGSELNILAKHLFDRWTITDMCYQQDPDSVIWLVRSDGMLIGITYLKEQKVVAAHWHDTGAI